MNLNLKTKLLLVSPDRICKLTKIKFNFQKKIKKNKTNYFFQFDVRDHRFSS